MKRLGNYVSRWCGAAVARYLQWVWTSSEVVYLRGLDAIRDGSQPSIVATWHGQHFLAPFVRRESDTVVVLVANGPFGSVCSQAFARLGLEIVRGAAGRDFRSSGGFRGVRALLRALSSRKSIALTVETPGVARMAGLGVIAIARHSRAPIIPLAVVGRARVTLRWRWDKPKVTFPYGRLVVAAGDPIFVADCNDPEYLEAKRKELEITLNRLDAEATAHADA